MVYRNRSIRVDTRSFVEEVFGYLARIDYDDWLANNIEIYDLPYFNPVSTNKNCKKNGEFLTICAVPLREHSPRRLCRHLVGISNDRQRPRARR